MHAWTPDAHPLFLPPGCRWQELPSAALAYILGIIPYKRADVKLVCQDWRTTVNESIKSLCLPDTELGALQHLTAVQHLTVKGAGWAYDTKQSS
jgi:hypothetical protein